MKKIIAAVLSLVLLFGAALPAFAFPTDEATGGRSETFGIAGGYVRTKESYQDAEGGAYITATTYDKKGRPIKEVLTVKGGDYAGKTVSKYTYDKNGNRCLEVVYSNSSTMRVESTFDRAGNEIKRVKKIDYEDNTSYASTEFHTYDKKNRLTKTVAYYDDSVETVTYTYSKTGRLRKEAHRQDWEDQSFETATTAYTYDKAGNETKMVFVDKHSSGSLEKRTRVSVYNEQNRRVKLTDTWFFQSAQGKINKNRDVTTDTYDAKGHVIREVCKSNLDGSKRTVTTVNTYDKKGNRIRQETDEKTTDYTGSTVTDYTFEKKRLTKEVTVMQDAQGTRKTTESYAYDKAGNLTKYVCVYRFLDGSTDREVTRYRYQKIGAK